MKVRIKETGEIVDVEYDDDDLYGVLGRRQYLYANEFDILSDSEEKDADTVIQGWVCRDEDGSLHLFTEIPTREFSNARKEYWWYSKSSSKIDSNLFPDLTWESDPEPVEIIIKKNKK